MLLSFLLFGLGLTAGSYLSGLSNPASKRQTVRQLYELSIDGIDDVPVTVTILLRPIAGAQPIIHRHEAKTPFLFEASACAGYAWIEFGDLDVGAQPGRAHCQMKIDGKVAYQCDMDIEHGVKSRCTLGEF
jgi:hypothetical protein